MKNLKYFLLMAVPVVLLSCGQSNTQNKENVDDGAMGTRARDYENMHRNDAVNSNSQDVQVDTAKFRRGTGTEGSGMGTTDRSDTIKYRSVPPSVSTGSQGVRSGQKSTLDTSLTPVKPIVK